MLFILAILTVSCQSDSERKSEDSYTKGIQTLEKLSENGEPNYEEAHKYFAQATTLNPDNINAQYWKADTEVKLGNFSEAFTTASTTLDNSSIDDHRLKPNILVIVGVLSNKLGKNPDEYFRKALNVYEKRINQNENNIDAVMQKAIILCYIDRENKAIKFLNGLSLNDENQVFLEQLKKDIESFDAREILDKLIIEK